MIKTKTVKQTPKALFEILILRYIKHRWWLLAWIWVLTIVILLQARYDNFSYFIMIFSVVYPVMIILQLWRYVKSKENRILFLERYYEIDNERINGIIDQDTYSPIKLEHFIKVDLIRRTYLLYVSKNQFIYIPIESFKTEEDRNWFENEILTKIKK
jgi:hypothetical protein